jgi:hypothetical protein
MEGLKFLSCPNYYNFITKFQIKLFVSKYEIYFFKSISWYFPCERCRGLKILLINSRFFVLCSCWPTLQIEEWCVNIGNIFYLHTFFITSKKSFYYSSPLVTSLSLSLFSLSVCLTHTHAHTFTHPPTYIHSHTFPFSYPNYSSFQFEDFSFFYLQFRSPFFPRVPNYRHIFLPISFFLKLCS